MLPLLRDNIEQNDPAHEYNIQVAELSWYACCSMDCVCFFLSLNSCDTPQGRERSSCKSCCDGSMGLYFGVRGRVLCPYILVVMLTRSRFGASFLRYDDTFFAPLISTLLALATQQTQILLAYIVTPKLCFAYGAHRYTHRHPKEASFWAECQKHFTREVVDYTAHLPEDYHVPNYSIFRLVRSATKEEQQPISG